MSEIVFFFRKHSFLNISCYFLNGSKEVMIKPQWPRSVLLKLYGAYKSHRDLVKMKVFMQ